MVMEKLEKSSHSSGDWSGKPVILRMLQVFGAPGASSSFPPPHNYLPHVACWAASQGSRLSAPSKDRERSRRGSPAVEWRTKQLGRELLGVSNELAPIRSICIV